MNVAMLQHGASVTAAHMNELYDEADYRASLCLDNHALLYLTGENANQTRANFGLFLGPTFFFGSGNQPITGYWGTWNYQHNVFETAIAGSVNNGIVSIGYEWLQINSLPGSYFTTIGKIHSSGNTDWRMTTSLFRWSLEAHKKNYQLASGEVKKFWIYETFGSVPAYLQRKSNLDQAELMVEGFVGGLDIDAKWNRFDKFRIHNCQGGILTVRFFNLTGIAHALTVEPYGSRCVRRDLIGGAVVYTDGGRYFQKFLHGDPRFYQHTRIGGNNITNPSLIIPFINHVLGGQPMVNPLNGVTRITFARPTAILDPHVRAPLPAGTGPRDYASIFGNSQNDATLLGDCLHHKGELINVKTDLINGITSSSMTFDGYGSINQIVGVETQHVGSDLQIRLTGNSGTVYHDFLSISSNLFCTGDAGVITHPVVDGTQWFTLDRHVPSIGTFKIGQTDTPQVISYNQVGVGETLGPAVNQTIHNLRLIYQPMANVNPVLPHSDTIGNVKQRYFDQAGNTYSSFTTSAEMTCGGLCIYSTQRIPISAPFSSTVPVDIFAAREVAGLYSAVWSPFMLWQETGIHDGGGGQNPLDTISFEDGAIVIKRVAVFTGYGFPDIDHWLYTGFLTPRYTRIYTDCPQFGSPGAKIAGPHPSFKAGEQNVTGEDAKLIGPGAKSLTTRIAILSPFNTPNDYLNGTIGILRNNDVLYGATQNYNKGGYWNQGTGALAPFDTNRKRCFGNRIFYNVPTDGSDFRHLSGFPDAQGMFRFIRMELAVEHYNNMAAKVNSIVRYKPLNWIDHGVVQNGNDQVNRYRLRPNTNGIFDVIRIRPWYVNQSTAAKQIYDLGIANHTGIAQVDNAPTGSMRPVTQYACLELDDALFTVVGYTGIQVKAAADLPNWGRAQLLRRTATFSTTEPVILPVADVIVTTITNANLSALTPYNRTTGGSFATGVRDVAYRHNLSLAIGTELPYPAPVITETPGSPVRSDLASVGTYRWITIADVQAYFANLGYKFDLHTYGARYDLLQEDIVPNIRTGEVVNLGIDETFAPFGNGGVQVGGLLASWVAAPITEIPFTLPTLAFPARVVEFVGRLSGAWVAGGDRPIYENELRPDACIDATTTELRPILASIGTRGPVIDNTTYWRALDSITNAGQPLNPPFNTTQFPVQIGIQSTGPCQYYDDVTGPAPGHWIRVSRDQYNLDHSRGALTGQVLIKKITINYPLSDELRASYWDKPTNILRPTVRNLADWFLTSQTNCLPGMAQASVGIRLEMEAPLISFTGDVSGNWDTANAVGLFGTRMFPFSVNSTGSKYVTFWSDPTSAIPLTH